jgi:hypothetical protein
MTTDVTFAITTASSPDEVPDWVPEAMSGEARDMLAGNYNERSVMFMRFGEDVEEHWDGGETEDNTFDRDWSWVEGAIQRAYNLGMISCANLDFEPQTAWPLEMGVYEMAASAAMKAKMVQLGEHKGLIDDLTPAIASGQLLALASIALLADAMRRSDESSRAAAQLEAELQLARGEPARVVASDSEADAHLPVEPGTNRRHSWATFREAGMLWAINRVLHMFGWAIVVEVDDTTGETTGAYPVRTEWRGFPRDREELGYERTAAWMAKAGAAISEETNRK